MLTAGFAEEKVLFYYAEDRLGKVAERVFFQHVLADVTIARQDGNHPPSVAESHTVRYPEDPAELFGGRRTESRCRSIAHATLIRVRPLAGLPTFGRDRSRRIGGVFRAGRSGGPESPSVQTSCKHPSQTR